MLSRKRPSLQKEISKKGFQGGSLKALFLWFFPVLALLERQPPKRLSENHAPVRRDSMTRRTPPLPPVSPPPLSSLQRRFFPANPFPSVSAIQMAVQKIAPPLQANACAIPLPNPVHPLPASWPLQPGGAGMLVLALTRSTPVQNLSPTTSHSGQG
jgi:hypothetical protein